jgi:hypothetical protein
MRRAARIAPIAGIVAVSAGCAGILGLDAGVGDGPDAGVDELPPLGEASREVDVDGVESAAAQGDARGGSDGVGSTGDGADALVTAVDSADAIGPEVDSARTPDSSESSEGGCPFTTCPDGCDDTETDPQDCGSCKNACVYGPNSQPVCTGGACGLQCTGGALDCDHQAADGCECTPVPNGTVNCTATGACGHVCDQGYVDCAGSPCSCGGGLRCLSDDTCGACRATLQPCQLGTDCCSGDCGANAACL